MRQDIFRTGGGSAVQSPTSEDKAVEEIILTVYDPLPNDFDDDFILNGTCIY